MEYCDCITVNSALQIGLGGLVVIKRFWAKWLLTLFCVV